MSRSYKIAVLKGDGIGPEVVTSAQEVLAAAAEKSSLKLDYLEFQIGWSSYRKVGRTLPPETLQGMRECDGWILGPLEAGAYPKDDKDYPMASGKIRKSFDLFANIRPVKSLLMGSKEFDFVIVRENTEDFYPDRNLYKGYGEFWPNKDTVVSLRVVTRNACKRISETAFALARSRSKKKTLTAVHKSNVLIEGDGLFLEEVRKVGSDYPDVKLNDGLVDSIGMQLVLSPEKFDVLVTTNLFGDIISDVAAAAIGGLGLAPSLNSGEKYAMAQAVHGSAPDIAGKGIANPVAEILSTSMLLEWLHAKHSDDSLKKAATAIDSAVNILLKSGETRSLTVDLGGTASTKEMTSEIVRKIARI
ncbi:MAG: isocitrate/isopropylmalate dehydrogenase family protein [Nitrososphaerota archaeon]|nr:isocitrate/isopropylmalate dehydrogenase family protein [Nitrososphaerota archaeon]MDG6922391.1 isocitrate/isopropylmalate dehydrogenase family protein [Nitrososphaerota archaeon]